MVNGSTIFFNRDAVLNIRFSEVPVKQRGITWYSWSSAKYWQFSDKLQASADSNRVWGAFTRSLGLGRLNSRGLALGLAEGTILFKFTVPIHMPLMLFSIVSFFRHRHIVVAETSSSSEKKAGEAMEVQTMPKLPWGCFLFHMRGLSLGNALSCRSRCRCHCSCRCWCWCWCCGWWWWWWRWWWWRRCLRRWCVGLVMHSHCPKKGNTYGRPL